MSNLVHDDAARLAQATDLQFGWTAHGEDGSSSGCTPDGCRVATLATEQSTSSERGAVSPGSNESACSGEPTVPTFARMTTAELDELQSEIRDALNWFASEDLGATTSERNATSASTRHNAARVARLSADLRAWAGCQDLCPVTVELLPTLCSLAHVLRHTLDARIDVAVDVGHDCPTCLVDPRAFEEALFKLVVNARDAMPSGGLLVLAARGDAHREGDRGVIVSVRDSGAGMTHGVALRAMQPFFTTKLNDTLAGLGLPAVEGFVKQSGGRMELSSSERVGTLVTLYLPSRVRRP